MKRVLKWLGIVLSVLMLGAAGLVANVIWFKPFSLTIFYERVFFELLLMDPELMTQVGVLEQFGFRGHNAKLTDASPAFARAVLEKGKRDLATLRSYNREAQSEDQRLSTDILEWFLQDTIEGERFLFHNYPVNQLFGVQSELPVFMATIHRLDDARDAQYYLARLGQFGTKFDQVIEGLRLREEMGIIPPRFVFGRVLSEMREFRGVTPEENILYTALADKLSSIDGMSSTERDAILAGAKSRIEDVVYPAYDALITYVEALETQATDDDGVWKFPDGDAFYANCVRSHTTMDLTPEEVHGIGMAEVERITGEMAGILAGLGHTGSSTGAIMAALAEDPRFLYPNTDEGRAQCIADYQAILDEIDEGISDVFDLRPESGVRVERIPEFREQTSAGAYYNPPALDGSRPGVFYVKLYDMAESPKFGMRTLAYHEGVPGHHFQLAIQQQLQGPTFRKVIPFTAYVEGWALYAEYLAWEQGYHSDPYDNLGRLQAELFRAVRLVVDTGIHYKRWSREQAIEYMAGTTGMPIGDVTSEIERYIVMPGQALAYKIGMIKIQALRERAERELGAAFDIREFHNAVLANGAMPLTLLEEVVERYIERERVSAAS